MRTTPAPVSMLPVVLRQADRRVGAGQLGVRGVPEPGSGRGIPFHQVTIRDMGLTLGEIFNFETLADDCEDDGIWEGLFSGVGLNVTASVGSPLTPMFLK